MTDRELLELAAKAAGIELFYDIFYDEEPCYHEKEIDCNIVWNPLTDDGDALRLAVAVHIEVSHARDFDTGEIDVVTACSTDNASIQIVEEQYGSDAYAATRRAIVRAAAEIGKSL